MDLEIARATDADVSILFGLRLTVAAHVTRVHGPGHWSLTGTERGVARTVQTGHVLLAREGDQVVGALTLATRKPWAINPTYFTPVPRPLYLLDMAVDPPAQGRGVGRRLLEEAAAVARGFSAQAIRLDAYDGPAGAGRFYAKCGYREVGRVTYRGTPLVYYELVVRDGALQGTQ